MLSTTVLDSLISNRSLSDVLAYVAQVVSDQPLYEPTHLAAAMAQMPITTPYTPSADVPSSSSDEIEPASSDRATIGAASESKIHAHAPSSSSRDLPAAFGSISYPVLDASAE